MNFYKCNKKSAPSINVQSSKTVTAGTTQKTVTPDTGYDAMGEVVVNPTPSTPITPSSSGTQFSAGLNNMSSSGWAYDSQQSGGTIKHTVLKSISPMNGTYTLTLSDKNYDLIKSGRAMIISGINHFTINTSQYGTFSGEMLIGTSLSDVSYNVIDSNNIGSSKTIYYKFKSAGQSPAGDGSIHLVYIE